MRGKSLQVEGLVLNASLEKRVCKIRKEKKKKRIRPRNTKREVRSLLENGDPAESKKGTALPLKKKKRRLRVKGTWGRDGAGLSLGREVGTKSRRRKGKKHLRKREGVIKLG